MLSATNDLTANADYQSFLNMPVLDYDFLPKVPHIPDHLPIRLQSFILDKFKKTMAGRTYMFPSDPCMVYLGAIDEDGYARIRVPRCATAAAPSQILSRFIYQHLVEEVDPDLEVHHLCGQPSCINPRHLKAMTHDLNVSIGDPRYSQGASPCQA